jgi:hypothetical protein
MPRGFTWAIYVDDLGASWARAVNSDYVLQDTRGWDIAGATELTPLPRGWLPRKAQGIDPSGGLRSAVVARLDADLWTGAATTFDIRGNDGVPVTCTVIRTLEESRTPIRSDAL